MTLNMQMNAIVCNNQTFKFYTAQGVKSEAVVYSGSLNAVSDAVFSMTGTLPSGVTFDTTTGTFTSDGTQTVDETTSVSVTVSSSNGTSTSATATMTLEVHEGALPIPDDYVFYASLASTASNAETGQALTYNISTPSIETKNGIPCLYLSNCFISAPDTGLSFGNSNATLSIWVYGDTMTPLQGWKGCLIYGTLSSKKCIRIGLDDANFNIWGGYENADFGNETTAIGNWHHACLVKNGNNSSLYIDGVFQKSATYTGINITSNGLIIIGSMNTSNANNRLKGWLAAARIYNRAITGAEITALASEFTPTT